MNSTSSRWRTSRRISFTRYLRGFAVLYLLLLTACPAPLSVSTASTDERLPRPAFVVTDAGRAQQPRFSQLRLWDITQVTSTTQGVLMWEMRARDKSDGRGVARFAYGEKLPNFEVLVEPTPLVIDRQYELHISGERDSSSLQFSVDSEGRIRPLH